MVLKGEKYEKKTSENSDCISVAHPRGMLCLGNRTACHRDKADNDAGNPTGQLGAPVRSSHRNISQACLQIIQATKSPSRGSLLNRGTFFIHFL